MPNEKTIQVHTHRIEPGAECNPVSVGDTELGYLSVFKFCPFCGVDLESFPDYAQFNEGEPVTNSFDTKTGEVTQP